MCENGVNFVVLLPYKYREAEISAKKVAEANNFEKNGKNLKKDLTNKIKCDIIFALT